MKTIKCKLTVYFAEPFWVGVFERICDGKLSVAKVTFGAEPKDYDIQEFVLKFGIGGANMPTRTPIPVSRAMRQISANLDLARRQQRIPVALLAERAGLSMPTVTKMLRTGNGSFENFLRIARLLGLLDGVQQATDPLNTDIGKLRADEDTPKRIR